VRVFQHPRLISPTFNVTKENALTPAFAEAFSGRTKAREYCSVRKETFLREIFFRRGETYSECLGCARKIACTSQVSYVYLALADYRFPPVAVERERAATDGKFNIVARSRPDTSFGRSG
jgi:hypothetical protein